MKGHLNVSEYFYSIQGEGKTSGIPSTFIRLKGCNLLCGAINPQGSNWICDSIDVWKQGSQISYEELFMKMNKEFDFSFRLENYPHNVIFTGGEPMLYENEILGFIEYLKTKITKKIFFEVETNGTIFPSNTFAKEIDLFTVSPKLSNSGETLARRYKKQALYNFSKANSINDIQFKFVVTRTSDHEEIVNDFIIPFQIKNEKITLMPGGETITELEENSLDTVSLCKAYGFRYSHRTHIAIWNKKTGV